MYKFRFEDTSIEQYFYGNVINPNRMTRKDCIKQNLPYIDNNGFIKNTAAFLEVNNYVKKHGHYPKHPSGSKEWHDFWLEEKRVKCSNGFWLGQVRITNYFYFFLNYHSLIMGSEAGEVRGLPNWWMIHFHFFHLLEYCQRNSLDFGLIKPRGCGLSECAASIAECNYFVPTIDKKTGKPLAFKSVQIYASDKSYLLGEGKIFSLIMDAIDWINGFKSNHGFYKLAEVTRKTSDVMHLVPGFITEGGKGEPVQTGGSVEAKAITKADKGVGGRKTFYLAEEAGSFQILGALLKKIQPNTWRTDTKTNQKIKTGSIIIWGTSNADVRGSDSFKSVLTNPSSYNCLKFKDVWYDAKDSVEKVKEIPLYPFEYLLPKDSIEDGVGWFIPYYDDLVKDADGNPLREEGYVRIKNKRDALLNSVKGDKEREDIMKEIADHPITIQEALIVSHGKRFNSAELVEHSINVEAGLVKTPIERGNFEFIYGKNQIIQGVQWKPSPTGTVHILEHPEWTTTDGYVRKTMLSDERRKWRLYLGGIDSIDQGTLDSAGDGSKLSTLIKKRTSSMSDPFASAYVAMYNERPAKVRDGYEEIIKLLLYFNAQSLLEYTKMNIKTYFVDIFKFPNLLASEPAAPGAVIKNYKRNVHRKGIRMTKDIINFGLNEIDNYIEDHVEKILFPQLLNQLKEYEYEKKTKFDLVAAMICCEILCSEYIDVQPVSMQAEDSYTELGQMKWYRNSNGAWVFGVPRSEITNYEQTRFVKYIDSKGEKVYE